MQQPLTVFVYGTLRRAQRNHALLGESRLLGCCRTQPAFTLLDFGRFPGVIEPGCTAIAGEVYAIGQKTLNALDALEGYPERYTRRCVATRYGPAWMYLIRHQDQGVVVPHGDWLWR